MRLENFDGSFLDTNINRTTPWKKLAKSNLRSGRKVLLIEDDLDLATSVKFIIEAYGSSVCEVACDAYEALQRLSDSSYDFILVDQRLPGMTGAQILAEIDACVNRDPLMIDSGIYSKSTPVVLMSSSVVKLKKSFKLESFKLLKVLHKKDLLSFLAQTFAS